MKRFLFLFLLSVLNGGCSQMSSLTTKSHPADEADSYARAIEIAKKNVDTERFKVYGISFLEGECLSNDLALIRVKLVSDRDMAFSQTYHMDGTEPSNLRDISPTVGAPTFEKTAGIDLDKLDPKAIAAQIAEVKTALPEGYTFKSTGSYEIDETVPSSNAVLNRNREIGKQKTEIRLRFTEDGKETESSAGQTSIIYYEIKATVLDDGTIETEAI